MDPVLLSNRAEVCVWSCGIHLLKQLVEIAGQRFKQIKIDDCFSDIGEAHEWNLQHALIDVTDWFWTFHGNRLPYNGTRYLLIFVSYVHTFPSTKVYHFDSNNFTSCQLKVELFSRFVQLRLQWIMLITMSMWYYPYFY